MSKEFLSKLVHYRTYAKYLPEEFRRESKEETIKRNMDMHIRKFPQLEEAIRKAYEQVYAERVVPSMRSFQFAGEAIERRANRIFNCSFLNITKFRDFADLFYMSMSGVGVGFSVKKRHISSLPVIPEGIVESPYMIADSAEGWCDSLLELFRNPDRQFDYTTIRPMGTPLSTGGTASGPKALIKMHANVRAILRKAAGRQLTSFECHRICCLIADCVVVGGVRRGALISLFDYDDEEMLNCKAGAWWEKYPELARANNSAVVRKDDPDFASKAANVIDACFAGGQAEPGLILTNNDDYGTNPCAEISLKNMGVCNLTEINAAKCLSKEDWLLAVEAATIIGTLQATYTDFQYIQPEWKKNADEEALLGVSITGQAEAQAILTEENLKEGAELSVKVNKDWASKLGINSAKRITTTKPSGCLTKDTLVSTDKGLEYLEELGDVNGDTWQEVSEKKAYTDRGEDKVLKFFVNGYVPTKKVTTKDGNILESSLTHRYRIVDTDGNYVWKRAKDLCVGDRLVVKLGTHNENIPDTALKKINCEDFGTNAQQLKQPEKLTTDIAWFLGLFYGDGSVHEKGIRISFNRKQPELIGWLKKFINDCFGLTTVVDDDHSFYVNSVHLKAWLKLNGVSKDFCENISVPSIIRKSNKLIVEAFIDGFWRADGGISAQGDTTICTVSRKFAFELFHLSRSIGLNVKLTNAGISKHGLGCRDRYIISVRRICAESNRYLSKEYRSRIFANDLWLDPVLTVEDCENFTYDIEVENSHTYLANNTVSHNTSSSWLGTTAGVHAGHEIRYIRRVRMDKVTALAKALAKRFPAFVVDDPFNNNDMIMQIPIKLYDTTLLRSQETAVQCLERVKKLYDNWIVPGHVIGDNTHNISLTINYHEHEKEAIKRWMIDNKDAYYGISLIPYDGGDYRYLPYSQPPHPEVFEILDRAFSQIAENFNFEDIKERKDNTDFKGEIACAGGACTID
jgi:ribonucleoside-diphosphate reductase alpha chain